MLKIWRMWGIALLSVVMGIGAVQAQTQSEDEAAKAKALLTDAVNSYKENGDKALAEFSRQGPFVRDGLYVFAINTNGIMLASGGPSVMLIGLERMNSIDDDHKLKFQPAHSSSPDG